MLNRLTDVIKNQQPDVIFYNASTVRGGKEKWIDYSGIKIHDGWMDRQSLISFLRVVICLIIYGKRLLSAHV